MCVSYPGRVLAIDGDAAVVEIDQQQRRASLLLMPEVSVGDWVVVAAGTVIERLEPEQAQQIIGLLSSVDEARA